MIGGTNSTALFGPAGLIHCQRFRPCTPSQFISQSTLAGIEDRSIAFGPVLSEEAARRAVDACVRRFNDVDDGWICTIEREDIYEQVGRVIDLCGFEYGEDWTNERDW